MVRFLVRRLAQAALVLWLLVTASFVAVRLLPGGPAAMLANPESLSVEELARIERNLGLDQPLPVQYVSYLGGLARADLGHSYSKQAPVALIISERLGPTLLLMVSTFTFALVVGVLWGVLAGWQAETRAGALLGTLPVLAVTVPGFWFGLVVIYFFAVDRRLLPTGGMYPPGTDPDPLTVARHLVLPTLTLALSWVGSYALYTRSSLRAVLGTDYIRTARAKGLGNRRTLLVHALPNAAIPLITQAGISIPHLLAGSVVVERIFSWPGVGRLTVESLYTRDYPVILGIILLVGVTVTLANLLTDIVYRSANPQVQSE